MSIENLRERNKGGKLDKLLKAMSKTSAGRTSDYKKDEYYYPERDKAGNGSAIIRFLPGLDSEDNPYYVERMEHGWKSDTGQWFIENCPRTLGWDEDCPACEHGNDLKEGQEWGNISKDKQNLIRPFFAKKQFYCNVLVVKDPANPENEGKVFPFKFGPSILGKIMEKAQPVDDGLGDTPDPIDIFDVVDGANFKFVIRIVKKRTNYEKSSFEKPSACPEFKDEDQVALTGLIDKKVFKSTADLQKRFNLVMGINAGKNLTGSAEDAVNEENKEQAPEDTNTGDDVPFNSESENVDAGSDNMEYFKNIAAEVEA